jgi:polyphosphate kinase 2
MAKRDKEKKSKPKGRMKRRDYEAALRPLQAELCHLQSWLKTSGERVIIIFEGRDAAGKGGTIKALTERVSPRVFRTVALPAPSDREKTQVYMQRYMAHFPAGGEVTIFDRSWYNRAGVEIVMGFCTPELRDRFLYQAPEFEKTMTDNGVRLIKYWLEVGDEEQEARFMKRIQDPRRQWKLSPMDLESRNRWYDYSRARDIMLDATDTEWAPWNIVRSNDKRRARLNVITHLLSQFPYEPPKKPEVELPKRSMKRAYDDDATMKERRWIPTPF